MKILKQILVAAATGFACLSAMAGGYVVSFGTTNSLVAGAGNTNISGWPTNTVLTTNGLPVGVGHGVDVSGANGFTFICQGTLQNAATNVIFVQLVTSQVGSSPYVGSSTDPNGTNRNDWSTTSVTSFGIPVPVSTNLWFNWQTNFPNTSLPAQSTFVGINLITNGFTTTNQLVNSNNAVGIFSVSRKIIPVTLSGP